MSKAHKIIHCSLAVGMYIGLGLGGGVGYLVTIGLLEYLKPDA